MMEINNTTKQKINLQKTGELADKFLRAYKKSGVRVSLAIVGATRMRQLNKKYRGLDKTTDVLSFGNLVGGKMIDKSGDKTRKFLGEIIINIAAAKKVGGYQAMFREIGVTSDKKIKSASYIFYFLLIHGLLHLVGYDDRTEKGRLEIIRLGERFLEKNL
jgi:probable rRNA maturation factor